MANVSRARAFPNPSRLVRGVIYDVLCKLAAAAALVALVMFFVGRNDPEDWLSGERGWGLGFLGAALTYAIFRMVRYVHGQQTRCPLCHGTPFHEQRSQKHKDATKFALLSHRSSAVLSLILSGQFRCMYCGTPFRLKR